MTETYTAFFFISLGEKAHWDSWSRMFVVMKRLLMISTTPAKQRTHLLWTLLHTSHTHTRTRCALTSCYHLPSSRMLLFTTLVAAPVFDGARTTWYTWASGMSFMQDLDFCEGVNDFTLGLLIEIFCNINVLFRNASFTNKVVQRAAMEPIGSAGGRGQRGVWLLIMCCCSRIKALSTSRQGRGIPISFLRFQWPKWPRRGEDTTQCSLVLKIRFFCFCP